MILTSLTTDHFRNLEPAEQTFHPQANLIVGRNGQGKTNLLEAIYFLATTKSFRTSRLTSLPLFEATSVFTRGTVLQDGLTRTISSGLEVGESRKRVLLINGEKVTLSTYLAALTVFAYSSARLEVIRGTPEEKRRFLDRGIASIAPGYLDELTRYSRVLKQRNALLQAIGQGRASAASLDAWDNELQVAAAAVQRARTSYTAALSAAFRAVVGQHGYHVDKLVLDYRPSSTAGIETMRREEMRARTSLVGPQRDQLEFLVEGRPAVDVLSGGEQKMVVLLLKFAKLDLFRERRQEAAVFLLDDIDAELDLEILQELLRRLPPATQVFATSAKERFLAVLEAGPHRRLLIENGRVSSSRDFA